MVYASHFSRVWLFATLWTMICQAPLSMDFSRQEHWNGLPCPSARDVPDSGMEPWVQSLASPALANRFFTTSTTWEAEKRECRENINTKQLGYRELVPKDGGRRDVQSWRQTFCHAHHNKKLCLYSIRYVEPLKVSTQGPGMDNCQHFGSWLEICPWWVFIKNFQHVCVWSFHFH